MDKRVRFYLQIVILLVATQLATAKKNAITDWLINSSLYKAEIVKSADGKDLILQNGLTKRTFRLAPNFTCIGYTNLVTRQELVRAIEPEAKITLNGKEYNIGGLYGQKERAYLQPEWLDRFTSNDNDFIFQKYEISEIKPYLNWKSDNWWASNKQQPEGKSLTVTFTSQVAKLTNIVVKVHYEIYDNIPLIAKWLTIENYGEIYPKINRVKSEVLGLVEEESAVFGKPEQMKKQQGIYFETNYAFNNSMSYRLSDQTTHWQTDKGYTSQVNYDYETPCMLEIYPEKAPGVTLQKSEVFTSVKTYELLFDSYDRERRGMAVRRMYCIIAPWTTANPIFMHLVSRNDEQVKTAIDQCAATGYEALILSFGSHLNMEDTTAENLGRWEKMADYAHRKGIKIGGYSLFSSRRISDEDDVVDPSTGKPGGAFFGNAPCFGSRWGLAYRDKIKLFFSRTNFDIWENDGPYPGDVCASTTHPGHKGLDDSQWRQVEIQKDLYHWLNERGVYINAPDWYLLDGTNKISLGYREMNFSLPREQQKILNRQNIFDGTWEKTPSMSWGFVPLTAYHGGGKDAILTPLSKHLKDYKQLMMQYYGAGVQACYRGSILYDTDTTKQTVIDVINWYKKYRDILNSDIIHLRRANGRDWDGWLHVNPRLPVKGLFLLFNPLDIPIKRTITIPLYYTGLTSKAKVSREAEKSRNFQLNRNYEITIDVELQPQSYDWWTVE